MADGKLEARQIVTAPRAERPGRPRSELLVARRYLAHGFLDAAMRLFFRNASEVGTDDWTDLANRLMERGRIVDAVAVCERGGVALPREELLALGDRHLRRKDVEGAIHYYELAGADRARWSGLVDVLTVLPGRELQAREIAERHLMGDTAVPAPLAAAG
jgi:hypothetical protein